MSRRFKIAVLIVAVLALAVVPAAFAGLSAVGVSPGFNPVATTGAYTMFHPNIMAWSSWARL